MVNFTVLTPANSVGLVERKMIGDFIEENMAYNKAITRSDVDWSVEHSVSMFPNQGGYIVRMLEMSKTIGIAVLNKTCMQNQVPHYLLSFLALEESYRDQEYGQQLIDKVIELTARNVYTLAHGDESVKFYKDVGFETRFLDMRPKNQT